MCKILRHLSRLGILLLISIFSCTKRTNVVALRSCNAEKDLLTIESLQPCITKPLSYYDVIEIALEYNLDLYAQIYEQEAQRKIAAAEALKMLPPLTLDAFYSFRSRNTAAFTENILPNERVRSLFPQLSSTRTTFQADIRETLNFIDFGVSYFRARQEKNKTLVLRQQHLRARQKLVLDITEAYWKAIASKQAIDDIEQIIALSENYQDRLSEHTLRRLLSSFQSLQVSARLADQQIQLEAVKAQYQSAKTELGGLMGLLPGTQFELEDVSSFCTQEITFQDLLCSEEEALKLRPELAVKDLEEKIAIDKIRENIVLFFPNTAAYVDRDYDQNPFLLFNYWSAVSLRTTWNLFLLPQQWQAVRSAQEQKCLAKISRLALSVAVISQVHLAFINYRDALRQYQLSLRSLEIRQKLSDITQKIRKAGELQGVDVLNFMTDALLAKVNAWKAFANLQLAQEQLNYAIGKPFYLGHIQSDFVECCDDE